MATIGDVTIRIGATTRQLESDLKRAERALQKSADKFTDLGEKLSLGVTVPFTAFAAVSLQAFGESEKAIGQVNAALTSTGNTANKTTEELKQTAASLQDISTFDDDEILGKVTANLLTFTSVANEQFDKAQLAIVNLSTRLGTDLQSATLQVGKALNDPIGGLTALKKAGIQFSDEQKNLIKGFVETNQIAKAQDVILAELEKQFGGSAEAAAKLGLGPLKQLQNQLGNLSEEFGAIIAEAILPLIQFFKNLVGSLQGMDNATKKTIVTLGALFAAVGPILIVIGQMISVYKSVIIQIYKVIGAIVAKASAEKAAAVATNAANASTVAFSTALRATLTVAAPYLALFGAIAGAAFLLYQNFKKAEGAQDQLNGVQQEAAKIIEKESREVNRLIGVVNSETESKGKKKDALNKLIELQPEYFKGLTIEKDGVKKINEQYNLYISNLKAASFARAAQSKQDEISSKIIDGQQELIKLKEKQRDLDGKAVRGSRANPADIIQQTIDKKLIELGQLNKENEQLEEIINKYSDLGKVKEETETGGGDGKESPLTKTLNGLNEELVILERRFKAGLITQSELTAGKVDILRKKMTALIDAGIKPTNKSVVELSKQLEKISGTSFFEFKVLNADKLSEEISSLDLELAKLQNTFSFGIIDKQTLKEQQINILTNELKKLAEEGLDPTNKEVLKLKDSLSKLKGPEFKIKNELPDDESVNIMADLNKQIAIIQDKTKLGFITNAEADLEKIEVLKSALQSLIQAGLGGSDIANNLKTLIEKSGGTLKKSTSDIFSFIESKFGTEFKELATGIVEAFNAVSSSFSAIFDVQGQKLDEYEKQQRKIIDSSYYNEEQKKKAIERLEEDLAKKRTELARKKAKADKAAAIFSATISGATAVVKAYEAPFGLGVILAGVVAAAVAAQIAAIASAPLPSLAIGTDRVKSDGMAYLHKGEAVVPADVVSGGFSGSNGTQIYGRLSGIDLLLSNQYAGGYYNRLR